MQERRFEVRKKWPNRYKHNIGRLWPTGEKKKRGQQLYNLIWNLTIFLGDVKFDLFPNNQNPFGWDQVDLTMSNLTYFQIIKRFLVGSGRFDSTFGDALTTLYKYWNETQMVSRAFQNL